jgi:hypothetical protein
MSALSWEGDLDCGESGRSRKLGLHRLKKIFCVRFTRNIDYQSNLFLVSQH